MAVRQIRFDEKDPQLRQKSQPVTEFGAELRVLVADMIDTMRAADGIGLAASQIGLNLRAFVIEIPEGMDYEGSAAFDIVLINPRIIDRAGEAEQDEGCLSVPNWYGKVRRSAMVVVTGQDIDGKPVTIRAEELPAQALQHEYDHLEGIIYVDRVEDPNSFYRVVPDEENRFKPDALETIPAVVQRGRTGTRAKYNNTRERLSRMTIAAARQTFGF